MLPYNKEVITAPKAPKPIGPYNAGIRVGGFIFTAGQAGLVPESGDLIAGGIEAETRQTLRNIQAVLEAAGAGMEAVVKTTVYLRDMKEFPQMNAVYAEFFGEGFPARTTIQAAALPKNAAVEIEAIAVAPQP